MIKTLRNIIILLLFASSCSAQTPLYHNVNGVKIAFTTAETNAIKAEWAANDLKRVQDSIYQAKVKSMLLDLIDNAKSSEGIEAKKLSITQVRDLFAIIAFENGALDTSGKIKPLKDWIK